MESSPKKLRLENEGGIDMISDMPDSILAKILSYLPTKYAVGTSILSTKWKNVFPFCVPIKLDLDDSLLLHPGENKASSLCSSFMDFVDRLLNATLSDVPCVDRLILKCEKDYGDAKIVSWVSAAIRLNVRYLDLKFPLEDSKTLFRSLNGCMTLEILNLTIGSELWVPDNFSLPNLKKLYLWELIFSDEDSDLIGELIGGCPVLDFLSLLQCNLLNLDVLSIQSPSLNTLFIEQCWTDSTSELLLDCPNLEMLVYNDFLASGYSVCDFKSLHTAHIDIGPSQQQLDQLEEDSDDEELGFLDDVVMIVSRCSTTIRLYLSASAIGALHNSTMPLPIFQNLNWLSLGQLQWALLARLLWNAPNLQQLTLEEGFVENEGGYADFKNLLPVPPGSLELYVKRIECWVFKGDEDEIKLVEYFLTNGKVLQNLILDCLPPDDISILTRLLMMPRQSKTCEIECRRK